MSGQPGEISCRKARKEIIRRKKEVEVCQGAESEENVSLEKKDEIKEGYT